MRGYVPRTKILDVVEIREELVSALADSTLRLVTWLVVVADDICGETALNELGFDVTVVLVASIN